MTYQQPHQQQFCLAQCEDLLYIANDDMIFDIDELFINEGEHSFVTQQQQQSTPILPTPPQDQTSTSRIVMTNQDWSNIFNGEYFNIEEFLNDNVIKEDYLCLTENG